MLNLIQQSRIAYRQILHKRSQWLRVRCYCTPQRLSMLMAQYECVKEQYPKHLLLYQVGDFYEMYYNDAGICNVCFDVRLE